MIKEHARDRGGSRESSLLNSQWHLEEIEIELFNEQESVKLVSRR